MTIELPEHLRTGPMADAARKALQDAQSMASASNSVPRISLRGREFRLVESGEEVAKFRDTLDVIILGVEPEAGRMIKTFYKDGYKSGAKEPPTCSSDDGIAPAPWVTQKQATQCAQCPKNVFGSATSPSGKATKACRDSKRAWVVMANGADGQPLTTPIAERTLYGLNVTVASLKAFSDHGKLLASLGQSPAVCVTRLKMLDMEYPQLEFELVAWLDAQRAPEALTMTTERPWRIKYQAAGLALAMGDSDAGGAKAQLPLQVPQHLQQQSNVVDVQATPVASPTPSQPVGDIDDAIGKW